MSIISVTTISAFSTINLPRLTSSVGVHCSGRQSRPLVVCRAKSLFPLSLKKSKEDRCEDIRTFLDMEEEKMKAHGRTPLFVLDWFLDKSLRKSRVAILKKLKKENEKRPSHLQLKSEEVTELAREVKDDIWTVVFTFKSNLREKEKNKKSEEK